MLPTFFTITPEMLRIIAELDDFKGQWRMIRSLSPGKPSSLRKVATIESVCSSTRIEGSQLTDFQVEELLGRLQITGGKPSTLKLRLKELIEKGCLLPKGTGRRGRMV
ncbi:MAG: hypothetical protein MUF31_01110 [Akkermansiaceae bacterium]|nr:hypothetical protein [Akkermansiaceae bacterium]